MVHVNSQVLLSSAHPLTGPGSDFRGRSFDCESGSAVTLVIAGVRQSACDKPLQENLLRHAKVCFDQRGARPAQQNRSRRRAPQNSRAGGVLQHLLQGASAGIPTTIGRRFRHHQHKILWFVYEFFLTSFPQPPILRFQARGSIDWLQRFFRCPQPAVGAGPSLTENSKGPHPTRRRASVFLRGLAGLLPLFFRHERCLLPLYGPAASHRQYFRVPSRYTSHHPRGAT
jgi:hypothetical protein